MAAQVLRDYLLSHPGNVKVGTKDGAGFVYHGDSSRFDTAVIERKIIRQWRNMMSDCRTKIRRSSAQNVRDRAQKKLEEYASEIDSFVPFADRMVVETYPSIDPAEPPGTMIILIEGRGSVKRSLAWEALGR